MTSDAHKVVVGPMANWMFGQGYLYLANKMDKRDYALAGLGRTRDGQPATFDGLRFGFDMETPPPPFGDNRPDDKPMAVEARVAVASPPERFDLAGGLKFFPLVYVADDNAKSLDGEGINHSLDLRYNHPMPQAQVNQRFGIENLSRPVDDPSGNHDPSPLVIVGVIDDGLPFAHGALRDSDGRSRVDYHWLQAADGSDEPCDIAFGHELTGADIDDLIARHGRDEDALYGDPQARLIHHTQEPDKNLFRRFTHGAHVLETAAGFGATDMGFEQRDRCRIVGVQLPRTSLRDTSGFAKETYVLSAVHYILDRAERIAAAVGETNVTVLINVSLGTSGGPKNGCALIEEAIDEVVSVYSSTPALDGEQRIGEAKVVFAAGNTFDARLNRVRRIRKAGKKDTALWRVQPEDRTASIVEVWVDGISGVSVADIASELTLSVAPPGGTFVKLGDDRTLENGFFKELYYRGKEIGQLSLDIYGGVARFLVIIAPTSHEKTYTQPAAPSAPAGLWRVRVKRNKVAQPKLDDAKLRFSIHRDEDPANTGVGGRQSYFERTKGKDGVTGYMSINGWATRKVGVNGESGQRLAVAGFTAKRVRRKGKVRLRVLEPATYSAAGVKKKDTNPGVDFSAVTNRSKLLPGIRGAGARTGETTILVGTSSAAPTYVRTRVLELLGFPEAGKTDGKLKKKSKIRLGKALVFER